MNCYGAKDLAAAFRTVRKKRLSSPKEIDESKYSFQPAKDTRTVAQQLVHIAVIRAFSSTYMRSRSEPRLADSISPSSWQADR
jgi:hypothetical protein